MRLRLPGLRASGAALLGLLTSACGAVAADKTVIQTKGSDTMVNVAQIWAEQYHEIEPKAAIEVSGGGSGVGLAALVKGVIDVATASRDIKPSEVELTRRSTGREPVEFTVGYDALAVYVHRDNPLDEITLERLREIYVEGGKVSRWSQLGVSIPGVADDTVVLVSRQSSSGTYEFFREHVLEKRDFRLGSRDLSGSKEVVELVGSTPTAIGYSGMGYATAAVKMLKLATKPGQPSVEPSVENVTSKEYPLARSLHLYTVGEPRGEVKKYIDWILSDAGQKIVADAGYVPVAPEARSGH